MKTLLATVALVVSAAFQMNAQLEHHKGETNYTPPPSEMTYTPQHNVGSENPIFSHISESEADRYDYAVITNSNGVVIKEVPFGSDPMCATNLKTGRYIVCIYANGKVIRKQLVVQ